MRIIENTKWRYFQAHEDYARIIISRMIGNEDDSNTSLECITETMQASNKVQDTLIEQPPTNHFL